MKSISTQNLINLVACVALATGLNSIAVASCGDTLAAMASGKAIVSSPLGKQLAASPMTAGTSNSSIVGLWYVQFTVGGQTIQEALQNWPRRN